MKLRAVCLLLLIVFLVPGFAFALERDPLQVRLPELDVIPGATWFWIGERMALNGVPMSAKMFSYRGNIKEVEQFYRDLLRTKGHGSLKQQKIGERVILGYKLDEYHFSVQLDVQPGQVQGKIVVTPSPLDFKPSMKTTLPVPPRSTVLSKVESLDAGRRAETLTMDSRFDVRYVTGFYEDQLKQDGWQLFSRSGDGNDSAVLSFQRGSELLQLTAKGLQRSNSQKCQFLINWIK